MAANDPELAALAADARAEIADATGTDSPAPPASGRKRVAARKRTTTARRRAPRRPAEAAAPSASRKRPPGTGPRPSSADLVQRTTAALQGVSVALTAAGVATQRPALAADGLAIADRADGLAVALVKVAEQHPAFRRALESLTMASVYGDLAICVGGLAYAIAQNHNAIPGPMQAAAAGLAGVSAQPDLDLTAFFDHPSGNGAGPE